MIVRALDNNHDWTFGAGLNNYLRGLAAIVQNINTRLSEFLGDCFFAQQNGIDWFNLLGGKNQTAIQLAAAAVILNTQNVTGILQLSISLSVTRQLTIAYQVQTTYGTASQIYQYNLGGID